MPLINEAWEKSFARVKKNQNAIADRGWNPLNRALLLDTSMRATMTSKEKTEEYSRSNQIIIPMKKQGTTESDSTTISASSMKSNITNASCNNLPKNEELNFSSGMSNYCLKAYLSNEQLQQAREEIRNDMNTGKSIKQQLKESTRLSAGIVFKAGSSRLGKTVFDVHCENQKEKNQKEIEKIKKVEKAYKRQVEQAKEVFRKKMTLESMTAKELTIICKPLKRKDDGKMPTKKEQLILKYKEWNGRPAPSFDTSHLINYDDEETNTGTGNGSNIPNDVIETGTGNDISNDDDSKNYEIEML